MPHLRFHGVGVNSYISQSHLVFLQGKVSSELYISQVVNPVLPPYFRQESDVLFSKATYAHIRLLRRNMKILIPVGTVIIVVAEVKYPRALFVVYNCPGQQDPQISRQLNTYVI